ncbi:hypothetical protein CEXT_498271 [Caerostris extrusa]|uniref:C2H2-type domain-containing protein n=1 Tax=Caerostris extrusa TaxID=172846 RepID=A0AAV4P2J9_CAEEX|nr:hypothetical protein CEXT_498271 [Caerostris extrusa]
MSFSRKENLKTHIKTHNGVKPYMCPHCDKSFTRKSHSREHMRTHATSTTHPCEMCSETFPSVSELDSHLKDVHKKTFQDRSGGFEAASRHLLKLLDVQTNQDNSGEESSLGPTSVSGNSKDSNSSECSSNVEEIESDTRDSSLSIVEEPIESLVPTPQAVA